MMTKKLIRLSVILISLFLVFLLFGLLFSDVILRISHLKIEADHLNEELFNSHSFLSNFGRSEYECSGNCHCLNSHQEKEDTDVHRRMISSSTMSRGIKMVFFALSTFSAFKFAEESLHNTCVKKFQDVCDESYIESEVSQCSVIDGEATNLLEEKLRIYNDENFDIRYDKVENLVGKIERYVCEGFCIQVVAGERDTKTMGGQVDLDEFERVGIEKVGLCEALRLKKEIHIGVEKHNMGLPKIQDPKSPRMIEYAKYQFGVSELNPFCRSSSLLKIEYFSKEAQDRVRVFVNALSEEAPHMKKLTDQFGNARPFCIGIKFGESRKGEIGLMNLENVVCEYQRTFDSVKEMKKYLDGDTPKIV